MSGRFPLPLARLHRRALNAKGDLERHQAAYYLWEAGLKLLAATAAAEYAAGGARAPDLDLLLAGLDRPALGRWWEIARRLLPFLAEARPEDAHLRAARDLLLGPARHDLPRAAGLDAFLLEELEHTPGARSTVRLTELFDRLVRYRNRELGHGAAGQRRGDFYGRAAAAFIAGVPELFGRLDVLLGRRLLYISDVRRRGTGSWIIERYELKGESAVRLESVESADSPGTPLPVPERVYVEQSPPAVESDAGALARLVPLYPITIFDAETEDVFLLNGKRSGGRLEYLSYQSGSTVERELSAGEPLGEFLAGERPAGPGPQLVERPPPRLEQLSAVGPEAVRRIGEFEILSRIGRGGMGIVYRAWQPSLGRQVALKCLLGPGDPKVEARFAKEIRALGRVDHPNLVKIHTSGSDGDQWFYAMELIEGADLASVVSQLSGSSASEIDATTWQSAFSSACEEARRRETPVGSSPGGAAAPPPRPAKAAMARATPGPGPIVRAVEAVRQAAEAAHALHEAGVVHRDIKPENIMLTADGSHAVLMDLGLAQIADDAEGRLTRTRQFVGTLRYASPEQLLAAAPLDRRSDVYGLGATLWELLTLAPLFGAGEGTPAPELMLRIQSREPESLRRFNPNVPHDLEAVVLKCLEKDRTRRYATAADLAEDLARWQRGEPVLARPPTARYLLAKFVRRHRAGLAVAALLLLLGIAGAVISFWNIDRARRAAETALFDLYTTSGVEASSHGAQAEAILRFSEAARLAGPATAEGRSSLVRARNWMRDIPVPVRAFRLENIARGRIQPFVPWRQESISFDPTGSFLLARSQDGRCEVWSVADEKRIPLPGGERPVPHAAWSPAEPTLALAAADGALDLWSVPSGGKVRSLLGDGPLHAIEYSADGGRLAAAGDGVRVWDTAVLAAAPMEIGHPRPVKALSFDPGGGRMVTACEDGLARVFDVAGAAPRLVFPPVPNAGVNFPGKGDPVRPIFVDGGRGIATATGPAEVTWWDAASGRPVRVLRADEDFQSLAASPDGRFLIIFDLKTRLPIWDLHTMPPYVTRLDHGDNVLDAAWAPDGSGFLMCGWLDARLWRIQWGEKSSRFARDTKATHVEGVLGAAWSPEGSRFATVQNNGAVIVWRLPQGNPASRVPADGFRPALVGAVASPDGKYLMPAGKLKVPALEESRVFAVEDGAPAGPPLPAGGALVGAAFSPAGDLAATLAACSQRPADRQLPEYRPDLTPGEVRVWDWRRGLQAAPAVPTPSEPAFAAWSPDGSRLAVLCEGGQVLLIDPARGAVLSRLDHGGRREKLVDYNVALDLGRLRFSPDGRTFSTWGIDGIARIWSIDGKPAGRLDHRGAGILDARYSPDGRFIATATFSNLLTVWEVASLRPASRPMRHPNAVLGLDFSPSGDLLLSGCLDDFVRVWDWPNGVLAAAPFFKPRAASPRFFDGDRLVIACGMGAEFRWDAQIWEWRTGRPLSPPWRVADRPQVLAAGPRTLFCGDHGAYTADIDRLAGDLVELEHGLRLAALVAARKPLGGGKLTKLTTEEWFERWGEFRRHGYPMGELDGSREARRSWHASRAAMLAGEHRWDAVAWHLDRLAALGEDVRARRARLDEFVRSWRFVPEAAPWRDETGFEAPDAATLAALETAALTEPLIPSPTPHVDLVSRFGGAPTNRVSAWLARTIECEAPRGVRLLVGCDDSVRVFVNRQQVLERLALQLAAPDQLSATTGLKSGSNVLLVEVSNWSGGWALFLRLEDAATGHRLRLTEEGRLEELPADPGPR